MILKDFYCTKCSEMVELYIESDVLEYKGHCYTCDQDTTWHVACTGGLYSRWRYCDTDAGYFRERFRCTGVANEADENDPTAKQLNNPDRLAERRDKADFANRRREGKVKIIVTKRSE